MVTTPYEDTKLTLHKPRTCTKYTAQYNHVYKTASQKAHISWHRNHVTSRTHISHSTYRISNLRITYHMSQIKHHRPPVARLEHFSYVRYRRSLSCHMPHTTYRISQNPRKVTHIEYHKSHSTPNICHATNHLPHLTYHTAHITYHIWHFTSHTHMLHITSQT